MLIPYKNRHSFHEPLNDRPENHFTRLEHDNDSAEPDNDALEHRFA